LKWLCVSSEATQETDGDMFPDLRIAVHLNHAAHIADREDDPVAVADDHPMQSNDEYYHTKMWRSGSFVQDKKTIELPKELAASDRAWYRLSLVIYHPIQGWRMTVTQEGDQQGTEFPLGFVYFHD